MQTNSLTFDNLHMFPQIQLVLLVYSCILAAFCQMLFTQSTMTPRPSDMFSSRFSELIEDRRPYRTRLETLCPANCL